MAANVLSHKGMRPLLSKFARYGATAAWAAAGIWLLGATANELRAVWLVPPTPPEVSHDLIIRNAKDEEGRNTSFRILLFTDEFRWRINSFDAIEKDGARPHFTDEMKKVLNSAREIRNAVVRWRATRGGDQCPTVSQLVTDKEIDTASKIDDPWGSAFKIQCTDDEVTVSSPGRDKKEGTQDDLSVPKGAPSRT